MKSTEDGWCSFHSRYANPLWTQWTRKWTAICAAIKTQRCCLNAHVSLMLSPSWGCLAQLLQPISRAVDSMRNGTSEGYVELSRGSFQEPTATLTLPWFWALPECPWASPAPPPLLLRNRLLGSWDCGWDQVAGGLLQGQQVLKIRTELLQCKLALLGSAESQPHAGLSPSLTGWWVRVGQEHCLYLQSLMFSFCDAPEAILGLPPQLLFSPSYVQALVPALWT
jgi:hypothetical protein